MKAYKAAFYNYATGRYESILVTPPAEYAINVWTDGDGTPLFCTSSLCYAYELIYDLHNGRVLEVDYEQFYPMVRNILTYPERYTREEMIEFWNHYDQQHFQHKVTKIYPHTILARRVRPTREIPESELIEALFGDADYGTTTVIR